MMILHVVESFSDLAYNVQGQLSSLRFITSYILKFFVPNVEHFFLTFQSQII
jgi:hypothetical protein